MVLVSFQVNIELTLKLLLSRLILILFVYIENGEITLEFCRF